MKKVMKRPLFIIAAGIVLAASAIAFRSMPAESSPVEATPQPTVEKKVKQPPALNRALLSKSAVTSPTP